MVLRNLSMHEYLYLGKALDMYLLVAKGKRILSGSIFCSWDVCQILGEYVGVGLL